MSQVSCDFRSRVGRRPILGLLALLLGSPGARADPISWSIQDGGNGHAYDLIFPDRNPSWQEARDAAAAMVYQGMPGHLVTVNSAAEHAFLRDRWASSFTDTDSVNATWVWIGLTDEGHEGDFRWITGEPLSFTAWHRGEPNNGGLPPSIPYEDYAHYWLAGDDGTFSWNDSISPAFNANNGLQIGYFVEFEPVPEPSGLSLLGAGMLGLIVRHRLNSNREQMMHPDE